MNAVFYNDGKILCLRGGEEHQYAQPQLKANSVMCTFFAVILVNYQKLRMNETFFYWRSRECIVLESDPRKIEKEGGSGKWGGVEVYTAEC